MKPKSGTCMLQQPFKVCNSTVRQSIWKPHSRIDAPATKKIHQKKITPWKSFKNGDSLLLEDDIYPCVLCNGETRLLKNGCTSWTSVSTPKNHEKIQPWASSIGNTCSGCALVTTVTMFVEMFGSNDIIYSHGEGWYCIPVLLIPKRKCRVYGGITKLDQIGWFLTSYVPGLQVNCLREWVAVPTSRFVEERVFQPPRGDRLSFPYKRCYNNWTLHYSTHMQSCRMGLMQEMKKFFRNLKLYDFNSSKRNRSLNEMNSMQPNLQQKSHLPR